MNQNRELNKEEMMKVSGGSVAGGLDAVGALIEAIAGTANGLGGGIEGLTTPSKLKPGQSLCCSNSQRIG